ncbi:uncharacterized protein LOC102426880 [Myotis lucifugus]|uniref:uncharacterized protein LOC102426880 n=1 Tax=Myotis lucifugus TaxID=59463 RepID=UPI000CCC6395|nr:uncharacterized protein LOC102426880 [Myotis lucifugus]
MSLTLNITRTLARVRRRQRRRRLFESAASILSRTLVAAQASKQLPKEDQDQDEMTSVRTSSEAEDVSREDLGPEPEAVQHSERVKPTSSAQNQPPPPAIVSSKSLPVVPSPSVSQPLRICYSKSLPTIQPLVTIASDNLPGVPLYPTAQPLDILVSDTQTAASMASQRYPLVHVAAQSHFQVPGDSERDFQNHSLASQTQPPPVQAFQTQALASQAPLTQLTPAPFFQTQPVDPWVTLAVQDSQALYNTQQAPMSTTLFQETELRQSSHAQEPLGGQELSQEVPDTVSPLPESLALATEAQQSMPHESGPAPTTQNSRHL